MSSAWLKTVRDGMHRENAERYKTQCLKLNEAINVFAGKTVKEFSMNVACNGTPRSRATIAEAQYAAVHNVLEVESSSMAEVYKRFVHSLESIIKCDITDVTSADVSRLSEADCRRALPIACNMICQTRKMAGILHACSRSDGERLESKEKHLRRWDAEASQLVQEVDRLRFETEASEERLRQLTTSVACCAKRLATLSSASKKAKKGKPVDETDALTAAVSNAERIIKSEHERTNQLERKLANAVEELQALRAAYSDASGKALDLDTRLEVALEKGVMLARKCEELDEKLRCSICMDREKNVTFACGHAYCDQCASEWDTCPVNCKRPDSDKPVKFRYPLFL